MKLCPNTHQKISMHNFLLIYPQKINKIFANSHIFLLNVTKH